MNSIDNLVTIETITPELDYTNNEDDYTHYFSKADVYTTKSVDYTATQSGNVLTYTIEYGNNGPNIAEDVSLTDTLPALFTYGGSVPPADSQNGRDVSWNLGNLNP